MFPSRIDLLPFWMPQMDVDIRKPITHNFGIERPANTSSYSTTEIDEDEIDSEDELDANNGEATPRPDEGDDEGGDDQTRQLKAARRALDGYARQQAEDERADAEAAANGQANGTAATGNDLDEEERINAQPLVEEEYLYDSEAEDDDAVVNSLEEARRDGSWKFYPLLIQHHVQLGSNAIFDAVKSIPTKTSIPNGDNSLNQIGGGVQSKRFKAPKGKRIHVPVRVEPKVYFAAERTFLSWLEFSIIIGSIAATLLNFGDNLSLLSSWGFTLVAVAALVYSVVIYALRVQMIRNRRASYGRYYDKWGTTALCVGILGATGVSFGLRIREDGWFQKS